MMKCKHQSTKNFVLQRLQSAKGMRALYKKPNIAAEWIIAEYPITMKFFMLLAFFALAQGAPQDVYRDLSKFKPKDLTVPPLEIQFSPNVNVEPEQSKPLPISRHGTRDLRAVCGQANPAKAHERIVGGWEAIPNQYPWMAALFIDDQYFCGGSLISETHVLTAAHCTEGAQFVNVMLGAHNVRLTAEDGRIEVTATEYVIHPNWNPNNLRGDMSIITLPEPVTFTDKIAPICLAPEDGGLYVNTLATLSGWGKPSDSASGISPVLRKTNSTVITNSECARVYGNSIITADHICIGTSDGHGSCNGDSGGPLSDVSADGIFSQIGVVSFGSSLGCERSFPAGFSRVTSYLSWISSITGLIL